MSTVKVPDIGDFTDVPVVEILVEVGQEVSEEDPLIALESDKATMEVPSPSAGKVTKILVEVNDKVSEGDAIVELEGAAAEDAPEQADTDPDEEAEPKQEEAPEDSDKPAPDMEGADETCQVVVLGAGPGGYTAAFRAADLGLDVVLVERHERLGGVCLNVGCIPSKALLHLAKVIAEAEESADHGLAFNQPKIDLDGVRAFKDSAVTKLTDGLVGLSKQRKVRVMHGEAQFTGDHTMTVGDTTLGFEHAIIAAGSTAASLPFLPEDDDRVMDSTGALELQEIPKKLLVIGGGIIGLEMATVYDALGSEVTVVELADQLIPGCDPDLVKPLAKRIEGRYAAIHTGVSVKDVTAQKKGLKVAFTRSTSSTGTGDSDDLKDQTFDRILVAVGRKPNGGGIGADKAGVEVDDRGFIRVDEQQRTNVRHVFAIGDVVGEPMLAHKATHEGKVAAEVIAGEDVTFDAQAIPSVAYTDPEVAWMGLTETKAKADGVDYEVHKFPWAASGRALGIGRSEGLTKLLVDGDGHILGAGMVGPGAGELIAEPTLALELGANVTDVGLTVHAHPTLSETVGMAAEVANGTVTDIRAPRRRKR